MSFFSPSPDDVSCKYPSIWGKVISGRSRAAPYRSKNEQTTAKLGLRPGGRPAGAPGAAIFLPGLQYRVRLKPGRTEGLPTSHRYGRSVITRSRCGSLQLPLNASCVNRFGGKVLWLHTNSTNKNDNNNNPARTAAVNKPSDF